MALTIDGRPLACDEALDLAGAGRVHLLACGDAFIVAAGDATRDGRPLVGHATRVERGRDAVLRVGGRRLVLQWQAGGGTRRTMPGQACRLCLGAFVAGEDASVCACEATFHAECFALRITCPACGAAS